MPQFEAWEKEYNKKLLVTGSPEPQKDVLRYYKFLKKEKGVTLSGLKVLDLGSGTGRNTNYLAALGNEAHGIELSKTAVKTAKKRAEEAGLEVDYIIGSFGNRLPFNDNYFDLVLDVTSSNSLNEKERDIYLEEVCRVLKPGGNFFVRALSKEGDKNAKNLLKNSPGTEEDTYYIPELNLYEKVFTTDTFRKRYEKYFRINKLIKKTNYATFDGRVYKRNYLLGYLEKIK